MISLVLLPLGSQGRRRGLRNGWKKWLVNQDLRLYEAADELISAAKLNGVVGWNEFNDDQMRRGNRYEGYMVELYQSDFDRGTIRVQQSAVLMLMEDISFNPNADQDWYPNCNESHSSYQPEYCEGDVSNAYKLGFFAAVTLEGANQVLLLNDREIAMSAEFSMQQRFFTIVELADQPFISNEGPAKFGNLLNRCTDCSIIGGTLGRSSHLGVHGSSPERTLIKNVTFKDYEESGITINGANVLSIVNCDFMGSNTDVPVRGTYSQARFMKKFTENAIVYAGPKAKSDLQKKLDYLVTLMDVTFDDVMEVGRVRRSHREAYKLFSNPYTKAVDGSIVRLIDGNAYGITLSSIGEITQSFFDGKSRSNMVGRSITVKDVTIRSVSGTPKEVVGVADKNGAIATDSVGAVIRVEENTDPYSGVYIPDALTDLQLSLSWWSSENGGNDQVLVNLAKHRVSVLGDKLQDLSILGDWAFRRKPKSIYQVIHDNDLQWACNSDGMGHISKGPIGLFVQETKNFLISNVDILGVNNFGDIGKMTCGKYEYGYKMYGFKHNKGYSGVISRGVALVGSENGYILDVGVDGIHSENGDSVGVDIFNGSKYINLVDLHIRNLTMGTPVAKSLPNFPAETRGIQISDDVTHISMRRVSVE